MKIAQLLRTTVLAAVVTIPFTASGCLAIAEVTAAQCHSQRDCLGLGPEFADTTCSTEGVCMKIVTDSRSCQTNQECIDKNGGAPYTCRHSDKKCVNLLSTECPRLYIDKEDLVNDNTIFIGMTSPANPDGQQAEAGAELARKEIKILNGMPPITPDGPRRPLGIVACNAELTSPGITEAMYTHLSEDVQVPYAIAGFTSQDSIPAATHFIKHNILMTTQNQVTALSKLADNDLVFRLGFSDDQTLSAQAPFLKDYLEARIRTDFALTATDPIRIMILKNASDYNEQLEKLRTTLVFNQGKSFDQNLTDGNLKVVNYGGIGDPINFPNPDGERGNAVAAAKNYKPHLVLIVSNPPVVALTWLDLMRQWPVAQQPLPFVIAGFPTMAPFMPPVMAQFPSDEARRKFFAMRSLPVDFKKEEFDNWISKLQTKFPELVGQPIGTTAPIIYDGVYMFAYALTAIQDAAIDGTSLARGLRKVAGATGGLSVHWGPDDFGKATAALKAGNDISYVGPIGSYGFDPAGDHFGNPEVFCFGKAPTRLPQSSGYSYSPKTNASVGTVGAACAE